MVFALAAAKAHHGAGGNSLRFTFPVLVTATSPLKVLDRELPLAPSTPAAAQASRVVETSCCSPGLNC
jgi:hypothetical protein